MIWAINSPAVLLLAVNVLLTVLVGFIVLQGQPDCLFTCHSLMKLRANKMYLEVCVCQTSSLI